MSQDFSKAKIYKITNDFNDEIYIGSTCDTLGRRFSMHKMDARREKNKGRPFYALLNEIGSERFRIELICNFPCEDKYQLRQKEGEYIRNLGTLNVRIAGRTDQEYTNETKEKRREYKIKYMKENSEKIKEYIETNKEHIKEYHKKYREDHKEELKEMRKNYREQNKESIKERKKKYYQENKEKISAKHKENYEKRKLLNNKDIIKITS